MRLVVDLVFFFRKKEHAKRSPDVRHGEREFQLGRRVRGHADLDRARPLGHDFVELHLEQLVRPQRPRRQHDAVVEVVYGTVVNRAKKKKKEFVSALVSSALTDDGIFRG